MVIGTATSAIVVIAGNVITLAGRLRMARSTRRPGPGQAAMNRVSGLPMARNSGETSTSSTVWVARA